MHGQRTHVLSRLQGGDRALVVISLRGLLNPVPDPKVFKTRALQLKVADRIDTRNLAERLTTLG